MVQMEHYHLCLLTVGLDGLQVAVRSMIRVICIKIGSGQTAIHSIIYFLGKRQGSQAEE